MPVPQHPGNISQQGLGSPQEQGNQYFIPNQGLQAAQAQQANAAAGKAQAEAALLQQVAQQQGLQGPDPRVIATADTYAQRIMQGETPQQLMLEAEQLGEVESFGMAMEGLRAQEQQAQAQYAAQQPQQGLI